MKCGTKRCKNPAACLVTWGTLPTPEKSTKVPMCDLCHGRHWDEIERLVVTGKIHYQVQSVPSGEKGKEL